MQEFVILLLVSGVLRSVSRETEREKTNRKCPTVFALSKQGTKMRREATLAQGLMEGFDA